MNRCLFAQRARLRARFAFTLVELLIVVSIVALLIAVLVPGLRAARNQGKQVVCMSNLRQIAQFSGLYNIDFNDRMPRSLHSATASNTQAWGYAFYRYATKEHWTPDIPDSSWEAVMTENYRCPFDRRGKVPAPFPFLPPSLPWSYGYNVYFELRSDETPDGFAWRLAPQTRRPGATVLFGEIGMPDDMLMPDHVMAHFWTKYDAPSEVDETRHGETSGYAFADGHADNLLFRATYEKAEEEGEKEKRNRWNPATAQ